MDTSRPTILSFLAAFGGHWLETMSGALSVPFAVFALAVSEGYQKAIFAAMAFVAVWFSAYRIWATERRKVLANSSQVEAEKVRKNLALLRNRGVILRNSAEDVFDRESQWDNWETSVVNWNDEVIETIRLSSEADAEWFSVLDVIPPPRIALITSYEDDEKYHLYSMHDFRLLRLEMMINQHRIGSVSTARSQA